jgi:tRNA pseudouridine65 synthase
MDEPTILHRDEFLVAISKPSGMIVHRGWAQDDVVALTWTRDHVGQHVYPVHRLDRGTSGVLLFALDPKTNHRLQEQFADGTVLKRYRALVRGPLTEAQQIEHPIPRAEDGPRVDARTSVRPVFSLGRYSWVEAIPHTGRLHQVRRHLKHISHPIIGDVRYGKGDHNRLFRQQHELRRLALHCVALGFEHPGSNEPLTLFAPVPPDLAAPLSSWGLDPAHLTGS